VFDEQNGLEVKLSKTVRFFKKMHVYELLQEEMSFLIHEIKFNILLDIDNIVTLVDMIK
jgi:hypothetical protein